MIIPTTAFNKIATLKQPIRIIQGGTSAGKTFSILLYLIYFGLKKDMLISIVAESIPVLKRGAYKDFQDILISLNLLQKIITKQIEQSKLVNQHLNSLVLMIQLNYVVHVVMFYL
jgi:phage terminase large subunit